MANKLTDLVVKEVSFCKKGAVPEATVSIYKSADPVPPEQKDEESLIQKIAKRFGLVSKEETPAPGAKESTMFNDAWQAKEMKNHFYDAFWTLDDVCWQIMNDETITDKPAAIAQACADFAALMPTIMGQPEMVAKCLQVRESLVIPARSQVEKAFQPEDNKPDEINKEEEEMTAEERQALVADVAKAVTDGLNLSEVIKSAVADAIKPVQDDVAKTNEKVEAIGKVAGVSQQPPGQDPVAKTDDKNFWTGIL